MSVVPRASFSDDSRMIKKPLPKSLLLRDYLLDDMMSSCSSNGFRSYPRRQCCTTIRFLVEMDLNKHNKLPSNQHRRAMIESKSNLKPNLKPKQPPMMQRASSMMINAFKHFPFPSTKSPRNKACFMPRSLSRKLLKHGLWKKTHNHNNDVKHLISLGDLMKKTDINCPTSPSKFSTAVSTTTIVELTRTNSNNNNSSNSNSWSSSDFTATTRSLATSNSSDVNKNDTADELLEDKKGTNGKGSVGTTTTNANNGDASENAKEWQKEQDEQSSPVCVMDFPSDNDNDEDEVSSLFQHNYLEVQGTKKLMQKTRRFPQMEPVKLENRIAQLAQEEDIVKQKALALLQLMKSTFSSHHLSKSEAVESLLLAFFKERIGDNVYDYEMLQTAKDWMDGHLEEMPLGWESQNNRRLYVRDMENVVKWSKYDDEVEKKNIGLELECEIFNSLVNDILLEFHL